MPRINIYLNQKDLDLLHKYLSLKYPAKQAQSLVVSLAIRDYIQRQGDKFLREGKNASNQ
jgi:hypothetical protein